MKKVIISKEDMYPAYSLSKTTSDKLAWDGQVKSDIPDDLYLEHLKSLREFKRVQCKIEAIYDKISREQSVKKLKERRESGLW